MAGRRMIYGSDGAGAPNPCTAVLHPVVSPNDSLFLSGSSPSFLGSRSMVSFEDANCGKRSERPFFRSFDDENVDEEYDEYFHQPEKKRRLTVDQVQFLEKSFEIENKLEPERKVQLAKDLGLQPRQVAIWFQNRRARWKTKQMEKDYDVLQSSYNNLKADYEDLLKEKEKLNDEVLYLSEKLLLHQKEDLDSDQSDTEKLPKSPSQGGTSESVYEDEASKSPAVGNKLEDISSVKSDVLDSESPRHINRSYSSLLEAGDQSDLSQDEEDNLSKNYMMAPSLYVFPKTEDDDFTDPPTSTYSCYYGLSADNHPIDDFWFY